MGEAQPPVISEIAIGIQLSAFRGTAVSAERSAVGFITPFGPPYSKGEANLSEIAASRQVGTRNDEMAAHLPPQWAVVPRARG